MEPPLSDLLMLGNHNSKKCMREKDDKRKHFNSNLSSEQVILFPINVHEFLVKETPLAMCLILLIFTLNLQCSIRGEKNKELLAAVLITRCPSAPGPAETNTGCGAVHQEYKSSPEQATVINLSNRITEAKNLSSTNTVF